MTKATVYRQEMLAKAAAEGISPLEVMMSAMREAWEAGDKDKAVSVAEKAAPYIHAKLASVQHSGDAENPVAYAIVSGVPRATDEQEIDERPPSTH